MNPRLIPDLQAFLSMMEKASFCGREDEFSRCFASFLDEVDQYLDNGRMSRDEPMDDDIVGEMEDFMNAHLPEKVRRNLKKLDEE